MRTLPSAVAPMSLLVLAAFSGCEPSVSMPTDDWWKDGIGGSESVPLLTRLDAEGRDCPALVVESMDCQLSSTGVTIYARRSFDSFEGTDLLLLAAYDGMMPGTQMTSEAGYLERYVGIGVHRCYMAVSTYMASDPCELELQGIQRGEPSAENGAGSAIVEVGSRVRMRVSCPHGLYYPGSLEGPRFTIPITPSEFALEAQDCVVVE